MKDNDLSLKEYAAKLIRMVDKEGEQDHILRVRESFLNWQFYKDRHYGTFNASGQYQVLPDEEMEDLRFTSDFRFSVETKATQWTQSSPELSLDPGADSNQAKSATRHAEKELEPYRERFWSDVFKQSMAKYAMLSQGYYINTRPRVNPDADVKVPNWKPKQISAPKTFFCEGCGNATAAGEKCPECGGETASSPRYDADASVPNGIHSMPEIDWEVEIVDPTEMKPDPKTRALKISGMDWLRRERYIRDYEAEALHPDWEKITDTESSSNQRSEVLEYKKALQQTAGWMATDPDKESGRVLQRQYWFDKKVYKSRGPEKTDCEFAGQKFKTGERLIDRFPNGWYIEQFNGKAVSQCDEDKNTRWVGGVDTVDPTSPYGRGFSGLRNLQEMKDEGVSLSFAYLMRAVLGTSIYDPMMVEASDYQQNRVGGALPLKPGAQIDGRGIEKAVYNVPYQAINAGFVQEFLGVIDEAMPKAADGAYDVLGGGQGEGAGAKTLGGQTQQLQTSAGMIGPALQLRTEAEIEAFYQYLELVQQYASESHYEQIAGSWGDADADAFRNCKDEKGKSLIRKLIKITAVQNSEIPRTQMDRRNDVAMAISSGIANTQLPILPGVRKYALEQLRIPIEDDPIEQGKRVAEALLEKMKQAAKYAQGMISKTGIKPDPMHVAQGISSVAPLVKQRDDTSLPAIKEVMAEFLRSAVDADEGIDADPALQQAVMMKIDEIEQFDVGLATDMNAKQVIANAPTAIAEQTLNQQGQEPPEDPNAQAEADKGVAEHAAAMQTGANQEAALGAAHSAELDNQGKALDHAENERARQHEAEQADKNRAEAATQRAHDLAIAKVQAKKQSQSASR